MKQVHKPMPAGTFARCKGCGAEPKYYEVHGRHSCESTPLGRTGQRHLIACNPCRITSGLQETQAAAESAWGVIHTQAPLQLRAVPKVARQGRAA